MRGQRGVPRTVEDLHSLLLRLWLERREQQRVCRVPEPHVLLRRGRGPVLGGHVQPQFGLGPPQLFVHRWQVGSFWWPLHCVLGWQIQHVSGVHRMLQHDGPGLQPVRDRDGLERAGPKHDV